MNSHDREMLNDLIVESREHLESIEPDLLQLEQKGSDVSEELVNRVFRAVHSVKGGFGFFGHQNIVRLSHTMETVVSRVRDKALAITPEVTDALLHGIDKLRVLLDDVGASDSTSIDVELSGFEPYREGRPAPVAGSSTPDAEVARSEEVARAHEGIDKGLVDDAVRNGKYLYQIRIDPSCDFAETELTYRDLFAGWERFGEIVSCSPARDSLLKRKNIASNKKEVSIVFATVLEPDLVGEALEFPQEQILTVDLEAARQMHRQAIEKAIRKSEVEHVADSGTGAGAARKVDTRVEEALRVRVGLLNNLMTYAGELVLGRNQLVQLLSRRISETAEADNAVRAVTDAVAGAFERICQVASSRDAGLRDRVRAELDGVEKRMREALSFSLSTVQGVSAIVQNIDQVTSVLQENIMQTRMQPIAVVFSKFPRVIRDLAKKLGKEIVLTRIGQDVELDKSIIEALSDPLTHLVRNCADHGIEPPEVRERIGKSRAGQVVLKAYQEGGKVIIEIDDDGAGIDSERVKAKALERGVITPAQAETMSVRDLQMLVFTAGFSTKDTVSDLSGRGVGTDVVKTNIERLGGSVEVNSEPGKGTSITLKLPLTLAIVPSLIVSCEGRCFAVPQVGLEEVVRIRAGEVRKKIERIHNAEVLRLRGKLLPLVRLAGVLGITPTFSDPETRQRDADRRSRWSDRRENPKEEEIRDAGVDTDRRTVPSDRRTSPRNAVKIAVLRMENQLYGLVVDDVLDSEEIVVKPMPEHLKASTCYSGVTIRGDGKVAMILDPNGLAAMAGLEFADIEREMAAEARREEAKARRKRESMLIFSIGGTERFAIGLGAVSRVIKRPAGEIEKIGTKEFLKVDEHSLPLCHIEDLLPVTRPEGLGETIFVIVPKGTRRAVGILASKVEDTVETELDLDRDSVKGAGIGGTAIIGGKMTIVLDVGSFLTCVEERVGV